ncbi:hypothetical protein MTO96_017591 [Rhipicephalus appendiculatus]
MLLASRRALLRTGKKISTTFLSKLNCGLPPDQAMNTPAYGQNNVNAVMYDYPVTPDQVLGPPAYGQQNANEIMYDYAVAPGQALGPPAYGQQNANEMMYDYAVAPGQALGPPAYGQQNVNEMAVPSNYPFSFPSAGSKAFAISAGSRFTATLVGGTLVVGVVITAVTVIVLAGLPTSTYTTSGNLITENNVKTSGNSITENNMKDGIVVPEQENTRHATEAPLTVSELTDVDTGLTTLTTEPYEKITQYHQLFGMYCTIGAEISVVKELPKYMCGMIFYDSLYKNGPIFDPSHLDSTLSTFLRYRSTYEHKPFGIGFAYKYRQHLKSQLATKQGVTPVVVQHFLDHDICNFGILDTPTDGFDKSSFEEMLESMKLLDRFLIGLRNVVTYCYTVLAIPIPDSNSENIYVEKMLKFFTPDVLVLLSHYVKGDNTFKDCRVMPPTMLTRPASLSSNSNYNYDLRMAAESIRRMTARGVQARFSLTVTMKGRWTVLKAGQPADFLSECVYDPSAESFGSYKEVCEDTNFRGAYHNKSGVYGMTYYNPVDGRVFSYDSNQALIDKMCRVRSQEYNFSINIFAYDVGYDYFPDVCHNVDLLRPFYRLYRLLFLHIYLERSYHYDMVECLSWT